MTELQNLLEQAREAYAQAWEAEAATRETFQAEQKLLGVQKRRMIKTQHGIEEARQQASRVREAKLDAAQAREWALRARKEASKNFVSQAPAYGLAEMTRSTFKDTFKAWGAAETAWRKAAAAWEAVADAYDREEAGTPARPLARFFQRIRAFLCTK